MEQIKLLDCTLRDGGHLTGNYFGRNVIIDVVDKLAQSKVDIIEIGFLKNCIFDADYARYNNVNEVKSVIKTKPHNIQYSLLVQEDQYDVSKLEKCDGFIEIIRVSFHDYDIKEGLECAKQIIKKGYKVYINPINLLGYSDKQILSLIEEINNIKPYGFTIVDTFGSMRKPDLIRLFYLVDNNLQKDIVIGVHLHENLSLSYSLAQTFLEIKTPTRPVSIDGSIYGMGRVPGNLCIELIMEHMNKYFDSQYDIDPIYDAIDLYINNLKKEIPWGYSCAYALSAQHRVHRTFAEYLLGKEKLCTKQINQILSMIEREKATKWDEKYIEELYVRFQKNEIDDKKTIDKFNNIVSNKTVLLIAPGHSIIDYQEKITNFISEINPVVFCANFSCEFIKSHYLFFSSFKRFDQYKNDSQTHRILTSNLSSVACDNDTLINYSSFAFQNNKLFDNCGAMLLKFIASLNPKCIYLAGFDGFKGEDDFAFDRSYSSEMNKQKMETNRTMHKLLMEVQKQVDIKFVTESLYEKN